jgi:hypothetical protein
LLGFNFTLKHPSLNQHTYYIIFDDGKSMGS